MNNTHFGPSRTERHYVCQAHGATGTLGADVNRAIGYPRYGQTGHEKCKRRQSTRTHFRVVRISFLLFMRVGAEPDTGCAATRTQVYRQCHVRVHERDLFGADARGGDCRQHRTERSGNA